MHVDVKCEVEVQYQTTRPDLQHGKPKKQYWQLLSPFILREALTAKRRFHRNQLQKKYSKQLQSALSSLTSSGVAFSNTSDVQQTKQEGAPKTFSLKELSVLQWARCEDTLFWNIHWYFAAHDLPYGVLYNDDAQARTNLQLQQQFPHFRLSLGSKGRLHCQPITNKMHGAPFPCSPLHNTLPVEPNVLGLALWPAQCDAETTVPSKSFVIGYQINPSVVVPFHFRRTSDSWYQQSHVINCR